MLKKVLKLVDEDNQNFFDNLEDDLEEYINHPDRDELRKEVDDYLKEELPSQEAKDFAEEAIKAKEESEDNEVDFDDTIIKSKDFVENECLNDILNQLDVTQFSQNYMNNFSGERPVAHLKFTASNFGLLSTINAKTKSPQNFVIEVEFNLNRLNRPSVDIARTFIHEIIHAEIFRKLLSIAGVSGGSLSNLTRQDIINAKDSYPGLYDYWTRYVLNTSNPSSPQHELMAQHMVTTISTALQQFDPSLSYDQAVAISWSGLRKGVHGDDTSVINSLTGLVVDPITNANESTVAWSNIPASERLRLLTISREYDQNTLPCQ